MVSTRKHLRLQPVDVFQEHAGHLVFSLLLTMLSGFGFQSAHRQNLFCATGVLLVGAAF